MGVFSYEDTDKFFFSSYENKCLSDKMLRL